MRICTVLAVLVGSFLGLPANGASVLKRVAVPDEVRGAALLDNRSLLTWGDALRIWSLPGLQAHTIETSRFGEGGCLVDLDGDHRKELVVQEGPGLGRLTWRAMPDDRPIVIDTEVETHDCLEATLFGRKGVLVIHRYMQVRFYEKSSTSPWKYREIYSIYTPSKQGGLALQDIDNDGRIDILCGNYWIQSPKRFDLPWHIFAIDLYFEEPLSALLSILPMDEQLLFVAQGHLSPGRAAFFRKPPDPRQLWAEQRVEGFALHFPHAALRQDDSVLVGEHNGPRSRVVEIRGTTVREILSGVESLAIYRADNGFLSVGSNEIVLWTK